MKALTSKVRCSANPTQEMVMDRTYNNEGFYAKKKSYELEPQKQRSICRPRRELEKKRE